MLIRYFNFLFCFLLFCLIQCKNKNQSIPLPDPLIIEITGKNYEWQIRYSGTDNEFNTLDDILVVRDFHLPTNTNIQLLLKSTDFVYFFSIPELNQIESAIPELVHQLHFIIKSSDKYILKGDQMCGYSHESLDGEVIAENPSSFQRWLKNQ